MENNKLKEYSKILLNNRYQEALDELNKIYPEVMENNNNKSIIPEDIFKEHFLPFFKNFKSEADKNSTLMYKWIELSGSPYKEVDIIDNEGNVVATVPPVLTQETANTGITRKAVDFNKMGMRYSDTLARVPETSEATLKKEINAIPRFINPMNKENKYVKRWKDLFKKYDEPTKDTLTNNQPKLTKRIKEDLGLDYGDD